MPVAQGRNRKIKNPRSKKRGEQVNITLPKGWRKELESLARQYSHEEDIDLSYLDLMRRAIQDVFILQGEVK